MMIGDGMTMPAVRRILSGYGVSEQSILTGMVPQDQGMSHLAACDVLVSPHIPNSDGSPFFGSPTKLFEYMALGKGIVASDLEQIGEILAHQRTAWLVKPGDAADLANGLRMLIDNEPLRQRMGSAAREAVVANYTWKEHTRRTLDAVRKRYPAGEKLDCAMPDDGSTNVAA